jgi:rubredoxin
MKGLGQIYQEIKAEFNQDICGIIKKTISRFEEAEALTSKTYLSISDVPYLCPRFEAIALMDDYKKMKTVDDKMALIFETGNAFQDIIREKVLAPSGLLVGMYRCKNCDYVHGSTDGEFTVNNRGSKEATLQARIQMPSKCDVEIEGYGVCGGTEFEYIEETVIDHNLKIKGHPDGFLQSNKYEHVLEIKTVNDNRYKLAKKAPFQEHLEQAMLYAFLTNKKKIIILYFNKNNGDYFTVEREVDTELIANVINRIKLIQSVVETFEREGKFENIPGQICTSVKETKAKYCELCERCFSLLL